MDKLIVAYNHFIKRDEVKDRGAVLANQNSSQVVTYEALSALDSRLVKKITDEIMIRLKAFKVNPKKVYIDKNRIDIDKRLLLNYYKDKKVDRFKNVRQINDDIEKYIKPLKKYNEQYPI